MRNACDWQDEKPHLQNAAARQYCGVRQPGRSDENPAKTQGQLTTERACPVCAISATGGVRANPPPTPPPRFAIHRYRLHDAADDPHSLPTDIHVLCARP